MSLGDLFENGIVFINGSELASVAGINWDPHKKFSGVKTKNIISGMDSNNYLTAMIVKIEPMHEIGNHIHEGKAELHEVIYGSGIAEINGKIINYKPGVVSFIPGDTPHSIKAGVEGLTILAKFTPPLG